VYDAAGNVSRACSAGTIMIDSTGPDLSFDQDGGSVFRDGTPLTGTDADAGSGTDDSTFTATYTGQDGSHDTGTMTCSSSMGAWSCPFSSLPIGAGVYTIDIDAKDLAGHESHLTGSVILSDA
jgi:hypothetical protein